MSLYLDAIRMHSNAKVVLRAHNVEHLIWDRLAWAETSSIKKWYLTLLTKKLKRYELGVLNKFDAIVPITEDDAASFRWLGRISIPLHVSPTGLDIARYKPDTAVIEPLSVFHIGALDWMPNQQAVTWFLKEIWPIVITHIPAAKFYLAGRNMPEAFKNLKQAGVVIAGEVEDALAFMNSKSVMVIPLLSGSGMRIKIIEGMAMGKAIVSTSTGAEGIDYTDEENIIIADTASLFAAHVMAILSAPGTAASLGEEARKLAESKYDNCNIIDSLTGFYQNLIAR
jgi:polysaccharide biosynthesis protein PslH